MPSEDTTRKRSTVNGATNNGDKKSKGQPLKKADTKKNGAMSLKMRFIMGILLVVVSVIGIYIIIKTNDESSSQSTNKKSARKKDGKGNGKYSKLALTNENDMKIRLDLDMADSLVMKGDLDSALKKLDGLIARFPDSPRAHFSKANALNSKAEKERSNEILERCIHYYHKVVEMDHAPAALVREAALLGADRMTFRGWQGPAIKLMKQATTRFPEDGELMNKLGVAYLIMGHIEQARQAFKQVLKTYPQDGFAMVHLGFIVKTNDARNKEAIPLLREGLKLKAKDKDDGKFYFHLGDALYRTDLKDEAYVVYNDGAKKGLFNSVWQRSLYNVNGLAARPWWTHQQTNYTEHFQLLETNWEKIRDEALVLIDPATEMFDQFEREDELLTDKGDWRQFTLFARGQKFKKNCAKAPFTCSLIEQMTDAAWCKRGQVKFSVMQPGVHVWPHCGPTNCRLRSHLGLIVPDGPKIRVANDTRTWTEGKVLVFDDSFEHEVWHKGTSYRLVLIVDFWHPELNDAEKASLSPI